MTDLVDLNGFDRPKDLCDYVKSLDGRGMPYEYVDEHTVMTFGDEAEYAEWLERSCGPDGFFEKPENRRKLKSMIDAMTCDEVDRLLDELETDEML